MSRGDAKLFQVQLLRDCNALPRHKLIHFVYPEHTMSNWIRGGQVKQPLYIDRKLRSHAIHFIIIIIIIYVYPHHIYPQSKLDLGRTSQASTLY